MCLLFTSLYFLKIKKNFFRAFFYCWETIGSNNLAIKKIPLRKSRCMRSLQSLLVSQASSFIILSPFPNTISEPAWGNLPFTVQHSRVPCPSIFHREPPREAEDFHRVEEYPKDIPLSTFLAYFPPKFVTWQVLFMCQGLIWNIISISCWF